MILHSPIIALKLTTRQLSENSGRPDGKFIVQSILQRADAKNENQRVYPKAVLEREMDKYLNGPVKENRAYGELDHTDSGIVNLKNASHCIKEIWWEGDDVHGTIEILNTPAGKIIQEILKSGLTVGISSRGTGSVSQISEDTVEVDPDYSLLCFDVVSAPSTHGAYLQPKMMKEGVEIIDKYSKVNNVIKDILCMNLGYCDCEIK